jgi:hypothetical protein
VYANDPIQARRELSSRLLQIILQFERETQGALHLSFLGDNVFIALDFTRELFEFDMYKSFTAQRSVTEFFKDTAALMNVIESLSRLK